MPTPSLQQLLKAVQYDLKTRQLNGSRSDPSDERDTGLRAALERWLAFGDAGDTAYHVSKAVEASLMPPPIPQEIWRDHQSAYWTFVRGWYKRSYEEVTGKLPGRALRLLAEVLLADTSVRRFDYRGIRT